VFYGSHHAFIANKKVGYTGYGRSIDREECARDIGCLVNVPTNVGVNSVVVFRAQVDGHEATANIRGAIQVAAKQVFQCVMNAFCLNQFSLDDFTEFRYGPVYG